MALSENEMPSGEFRNVKDIDKVPVACSCGEVVFVVYYFFYFSFEISEIVLIYRQLTFCADTLSSRAYEQRVNRYVLTKNNNTLASRVIILSQKMACLVWWIIKKKENIETSDLGFQFWESCSCLDTQVRCCLCSLYSQELTLHKIAREHFSQSWHGTRTWRNHLTNGKLTNEKLHESGLWRAAALQEQKVSVSFERWRHKDIPDGSCISIACAGHA